MSGFLNLGGEGGAMSRAATARALDATFVINAARPAFVAYQVQISCPAGATGTISLRTDAAAPPVTTVAAQQFQVPAAGALTQLRFTLSAFVLPGHNVRLVTTIDGGAPTFAILGQSELVL